MTDTVQYPNKQSLWSRFGIPLLLAAVPMLLAVFFVTFPYFVAQSAHNDRQDNYRTLQRLLLSETPEQRADMSPATMAIRQKVALDFIVSDFTEDFDLTGDDRKQIVDAKDLGTPINLPVGDFSVDPYSKQINFWHYRWAWPVMIGFFVIAYLPPYFSCRSSWKKSQAQRTAESGTEAAEATQT